MPVSKPLIFSSRRLWSFWSSAKPTLRSLLISTMARSVRVTIPCGAASASGARSVAPVMASLPWLVAATVMPCPPPASSGLFRPSAGAPCARVRTVPAGVPPAWDARRGAVSGVEGRAGHSLRVGAAQSLAGAGASLVEMQTVGRWKAPAMPARYARAACGTRRRRTPSLRRRGVARRAKEAAHGAPSASGSLPPASNAKPWRPYGRAGAAVRSIKASSARMASVCRRASASAAA